MKFAGYIADEIVVGSLRMEKCAAACLPEETVRQGKDTSDSLPWQPLGMDGDEHGAGTAWWMVHFVLRRVFF